jgi:hypothetical protein
MLEPIDRCTRQGSRQLDWANHRKLALSKLTLVVLGHSTNWWLSSVWANFRHRPSAAAGKGG